ncbi:MAG: hypothetical protein AB7O55_20375 [Lautropia sp.]
MTVTGWLLVGTLLALHFAVYLPDSRSYPFSDEWNYLPSLGMGVRDFLDWLFQQHVDHRIPIQKLLHIALLRTTGFDFRVPIAFNLFVAAAMAIFLMRLARQYRGRPLLGDLFIPLCILNPATGHAQWGFEFQFLSSIFFVTAFLLFVGEFARSHRTIYTRLAVAALFLAAWSGMNGVILSAILSLGVLAYGVVDRRRIDRTTLLMAGVTLAVDAALVYFWSASPASLSESATPAALWRFVQGMVNAPLIVYAFTARNVKFALFAALIVGAAVLGSRRLLRTRPMDPVTAALLAVLVATLVLVAAVASGRARGDGWSPGLEMHYGVLVMILPATAWLLVSANLPKRPAAVLGVVLLVLFTAAYRANHNWRVASLADARAANLAARDAIAGDAAADVVAARHIDRYYFIDNAEARSYVTEGIVTLRELQRPRR